MDKLFLPLFNIQQALSL